MARMLPPTISPNTPSGAERAMFERIRDELSNDWTALHSVGMTIHDAKPWAEIDFVLVGPPGAFCLEVKGGLISREKGVWYTTRQRGPQAGRRERLKESPFEQVGSASAQLFRVLERALPKMTKAITGYAVITPDVAWTVQGPDVDTALVYDQRDTLAPFAAFMDRVVVRWNQRVGSGWHRKLETLGRDDKRTIVESIRGDFQLVPSLRATAESADRELVRLTEEQCALFARLAANPRVVAHGGAGTGKTVIAVEDVRRLAAAGDKVLYMCFSRNLAEQVARTLAGIPGITVRTLHSLMSEVVETAGRSGELPDVDHDDLFGLFLPELALEVLLESAAPRYDIVVVDEAQDLLRGEYLDVIEGLLGGQFDSTRWRFFLDPNQNLFGGISAASLDRLRRAAAVDWPLMVNCRNTAPIATQVSLLSGVPLTAVLAPEGPAVDLVWYDSSKPQHVAVKERLRQLMADGFLASHLTVLSRYRLSNSVVASGVGQPLTDVSRGRLDPDDGTVTFSTISSFKGLESDVVLLVDVDDLESPEGLASVYVGASRARVALVVFLSVTQRDRFRALAREFGRAAAGNVFS
jgi:Nuclease-related domain/AAA domain